MEHNYYEISGLPIVVFDNFYDKDCCDKIWQELCFLNNDDEKLYSAEQTGSAWNIDENGEKVFLKKNKGVFLDELYGQNRNFSNILKCNRKLFSHEVMNFLIDKHMYFRYLREINFDVTLVQYYEKSDYYDYHTDTSVITFINWFHKKPKSFTGGNLLIENQLSVECGYNRVVVLPSILSHSVEETSVSQDLLGKNFGRYSISTLTGIKLN
jgi:hypothetical protein